MKFTVEILYNLASFLQHPFKKSAPCRNTTNIHYIFIVVTLRATRQLRVIVIYRTRGSSAPTGASIQYATLAGHRTVMDGRISNYQMHISIHWYIFLWSSVIEQINLSRYLGCYNHNFVIK